MSHTTIANIATVDEAAEMFGFNRHTLICHIHKGNVPARKIGRTWIVDLEDVEEWTKRPERERQCAVLELHSDGESAASIANILGIKYRSVQKALNRAGIHVRPGGRPPLTPEDKAEFVKLWNELRSAKKVALALGISASTATSRATALRRQGYEVPKLKPGRKHG